MASALSIRPSKNSSTVLKTLSLATPPITPYVFLAQFGFDDAVIYSLYKPFAEKNKDDIDRKSTRLNSSH